MLYPTRAWFHTKPAAVALDNFIVRREIVGLYRLFVEHQYDLIEDLFRRDAADPEYDLVRREAEQEFLAVWFSQYAEVEDLLG